MKGYTKDEIQYIRRNAGKMTYDEIANNLTELGISKHKRTETAISTKANRLGIKPGNWKLVNVVTGKPYTNNIRRKATKSTGKYYKQPRQLKGVSETFNEDDFKDSPNGWYYKKERIDRSKIKSLQNGINVMRIRKNFQF